MAVLDTYTLLGRLLHLRSSEEGEQSYCVTLGIDDRVIWHNCHRAKVHVSGQGLAPTVACRSMAMTVSQGCSNE